MQTEILFILAIRIPSTKLKQNSNNWITIMFKWYWAVIHRFMEMLITLWKWTFFFLQAYESNKNGWVYLVFDLYLICWNAIRMKKKSTIGKQMLRNSVWFLIKLRLFIPSDFLKRNTTCMPQYIVLLN